MQQPETPDHETDDYRHDLALYSKNVVRIVTKQAKLSPLEFNFAQRFVHSRIAKQMRETGRVRAIVLKARQEGVSTYVAARFFRQATLWPNQTCVVIADTHKRGGTIFGIYERIDSHCPEEWRPQKSHYRKSNTLTYAKPLGGGLNSRIQVETANDAAAGRGDTIQTLHATEFAFWESAETVWVGLAQAVPDSGSEIIIESTANGVGNLFHQMWEEAAAQDSGYIAIFLPWFIHEEYREQVSDEREKDIRATLTAWEEMALEVGIEWEGEAHRLDISQVAWRRTKIRDGFRGDDRAFRQEFPSTPDEAFITSGNVFFDEEALSHYRESSKIAPIRANLVLSGDAFAPIRSERGYLRIWEPPREDGHYVIAGDTATGRQVKARQSFSEAGDERGGRDFCCADVFDVVSRSFVAQLHGGMPPEVFADQLQMLGKHYSIAGMPDFPERRRPALIAVESNHSSGETVLRILKDDYGYQRLFYHRQINRRTNKQTEVLGWRTNVENRQQMLDDLAQAFRENQIHMPNPDTIRECFTFVRQEKDGKPLAQEGCHDDRVISAAIALQIARGARPHVRTRLPEFQTGNSPTGWSNY